MSQYLKNHWYVVAQQDELGDKPLARTVMEKPLVIFKGKAKKVGVLDDLCAHRLTPLSLGEIVGDTIQCGYHGWTFDCEGKCVSIPNVKKINNISVFSYPVIEKWGWIFVWMGEPDLAHQTPLPDFHVIDEEKWVGSGSMLNVAANCDLIRDNLLDLTHAKYTHKQTLATDEVDEVPIIAKKIGNMVSVKRVMKNIKPSPFFAKSVGYKENIIHRQTTEYTPGCNIVIRLRGSSAPGTSENKKNGFRVLNAMTPETKTSTHYFWWLGRDYDQNNSELTQWMKDANARTFLEDKVVLEAQQQNMILNPNKRPIPSPMDKGIALAEKLNIELLEREEPTQSLKRRVNNAR